MQKKHQYPNTLPRERLPFSLLSETVFWPLHTAPAKQTIVFNSTLTVPNQDTILLTALQTQLCTLGATSLLGWSAAPLSRSN